MHNRGSNGRRVPSPAVDVIIQRSPLSTRQPDVLFLSAKRTGITGRSQLRKKLVTEIIPDLVVEVLSQSDSREELDEKLKDYQRIGVLECWLVSSEAETVEVLQMTRRASSRIGLWGIDGILDSELLHELKLPVREFFE
jgi:Uma2 family endonuclease